ncbi:hypothetical protein [Salinicoccus roseus]|uniref:hypothetical protein n=1 Tax=Salinicoccus roseus TaxID=45670 RepID=UPI0022FFF49B|nr:hypothetical protein [Salinicoccus roseus]
MSKVFYPEKFIMVPASSPHPPNTEYKVSVGKETWDGSDHQVIKVQMVYNNKVSGRRSPSYPVGSCDFQKVLRAASKIMDEIDNFKIRTV